MQGFVLLVFLVASAASVSIWPQPAVLFLDETGFVPLCSSDSFSFVLTDGLSLPVLEAAFSRYKKLIFQNVTLQPSSDCFSQLFVTVDSKSLKLQDADESYLLKRNSLDGASFVGVLRGLESFASLISLVNGTYMLPIDFTANDVPRFAHRGIMIDSARHFLPVETILSVLDAMSYAKLNVLHWHLTDAESFPIFLPKEPSLSRGAFNPSSVYQPSDVALVVDYAFDRGIRVIPEIDIPGHAYSWRVGQPQLVSSCFPNMTNINDFPLNIALPATYQAVSNVIQDLANLFMDDLHLGGDEVIGRCWLSDPSIVAWMKQQGFNTTDQALQFFHSKVESFIPSDRRVIYWQEVAEFNISSPTAVYQIWKDSTTLASVVQSNRTVLASFGWYFVNPTSPTWKSFYLNDPCANLTASQCQFVLGGEACAWGETINANNLQQVLWPLGLAAAERLWSAQNVNSTVDALPRLNAKICQLNQRGIPSGPAAPGAPWPFRMHEFLEEEEAEWGNPWHHMLAGSVAGTVEHCGMFPLDTIKTHAQAAGAKASISEISRNIFRESGFRGFFRGLPAMISGAAPAHAVFFGMYEFTKHQLGGNMAGHHPMEVAFAGACATVAMDGILTPMDAVKQRMQISTGVYSNVIDCIRKVRARDGLRSLYAGYGTTLVMNVPYSTVFFTSYETLKKAVGGEQSESVALHLSCGAAAGVTAAAITTPLDVAKTRLQTQHESGKRYSGLMGALNTIWKEEGFSGLLRGLRPRIMLHSTSSAIVWATYEYMKAVLAGGDLPTDEHKKPELKHVHSV